MVFYQRFSEETRFLGVTEGRFTLGAKKPGFCDNLWFFTRDFLKKPGFCNRHFHPKKPGFLFNHPES
ncbi:hypothetical protein [[Phormidium] sp. ETS-05]|uniref:hypothetical protein n=1 Tax=[Phormidium] sp. ETS-05 TaxID=222819 RepID=UPI0018EF218E|nr:hypothetical protein [[Phormidium] sp. ETS-05]